MQYIEMHLMMTALSFINAFFCLAHIKVCATPKTIPTKEIMRVHKTLHLFILSVFFLIFVVQTFLKYFQQFVRLSLFHVKILWN